MLSHSVARALLLLVFIAQVRGIIRCSSEDRPILCNGGISDLPTCNGQDFDSCVVECASGGCNSATFRDSEVNCLGPGSCYSAEFYNSDVSCCCGYNKSYNGACRFADFYSSKVWCIGEEQVDCDGTSFRQCSCCFGEGCPIPASSCYTSDCTDGELAVGEEIFCAREYLSLTCKEWGNPLCKHVALPTKPPTSAPVTPAPTRQPTGAPVPPTLRPTCEPTQGPSAAPTTSTPTAAPTGAADVSTDAPTAFPIKTTDTPNASPTMEPTKQPIASPSRAPTTNNKPTAEPSQMPVAQAPTNRSAAAATADPLVSSSTVSIVAPNDGTSTESPTASSETEPSKRDSRWEKLGRVETTLAIVAMVLGPPVAALSGYFLWRRQHRQPQGTQPHVQTVNQTNNHMTFNGNNTMFTQTVDASTGA